MNRRDVWSVVAVLLLIAFVTACVSFSVLAILPSWELRGWTAGCLGGTAIAVVGFGKFFEGKL